MRVDRRRAMLGAVLCFGLLGGGAPASSATPPDCSVDAQIAAMGKVSVGAGIIDASGATQKSRIGAKRGQLRLFFVQVDNTGTQSDPMILGASISAPKTAVMVSDGSVDATRDVLTGTYETGPVAAGTSHNVVIWMRPYATGPTRLRSVALSAHCKDASSPTDTVIAQIRVR